MNTKPHRFVLLALLVLLGVWVSPVSAYVLENTYSISPTDGTGGINSVGTGLYQGMKFQMNGSVSTEITKIEYDGTAYVYSCANTTPLSGSYSNIIYDPGLTQVAGDYTFTWEVDELTNYSAPFQYTIDFEWDPGYSADAAITTYTLVGLHNQYFQNTGSFNGQRNTSAISVFTASDYWGYFPLHGSSYRMVGSYEIYSGSEVVTPVAGFTCTPTSQFPDADVICTDTSTNTPTDWYWSIDAEAMGIDGWMTATTQNFTWQSHYPGFYSVNLKVNNSAGFDWENKTNYVSISENATPNNCNLPVASGYIRTYAQCMDSISLGVVSGCDIQLNDKEGGAWSNVTNRVDGWWCIDTYPYHHIDAYGQATGYTGASNLNLPASDTITYPILLIPGYVPDAPEGEVYVFAKVSDIDTLYPIEGATVTAACSGCAITPKATNTAGVAIFTVANQTQITFTAYKSGYTSISKTITTSDFGPDTAILEMHKQVITPTATATTGPGGTTYPTYTPTPGPGGTMAPGYTNMQAQMWMDWLAGHGFMLIELCFFVTVCALLGFKFGK